MFDLMGGGEVFNEVVKENLVVWLSEFFYVFSVIVYVDDKFVGLVNCFEGFFIFVCEFLVNIYDMCVLFFYRGFGLS